MLRRFVVIDHLEIALGEVVDELPALVSDSEDDVHFVYLLDDGGELLLLIAGRLGAGWRRLLWRRSLLLGGSRLLWLCRRRRCGRRLLRRRRVAGLRCRRGLHWGRRRRECRIARRGRLSGWVLAGRGC